VPGADQVILPSGVERIEFDGIAYAEIIRAEVRVNKTTFFSPPESAFQFGLLAHGAGYAEPPHCHKVIPRVISDVQQMFVVQCGVVAVQFFSDDGDLLREIVLNPGDAVVLIHGAHAIRVIEDMQCISVKQGPFMGDNSDKVNLKDRG
jgi:hypothetical protein